MNNDTFSIADKTFNSRLIVGTGKMGRLAGEALRAADSSPDVTAVICPPIAADVVRDVAAHGEKVPRKSTSFAPKPRTGLVLRSFALG